MAFKYKKKFRLKLNNKGGNLSIINRTKLKYGTLGLLSLQSVIVHYKQIDFLRIRMSRLLKKLSNLRFKIYIRIFFIFPITQKPKLTRMGKGSGSIKEWVGCLKPGLLFLELHSDIPQGILKKALSLSAYSIPIKSLYVVHKVTKLS
jgi:ribosomal protein L16